MNDPKVRYRWHALVFPFFNVMLNGFNFVFHMLAGRYLSSEQYGQVNALLALFTLLSVVGLSIQLVVAKLSFYKADRAGLPHPKVISLFAGLLCFFLLVLTPIMNDIFQTSSLAYLWLILILWFHIITSYHRGMMQGSGHLLKLNYSFYMEVGGKLLVVVFFVICTKAGLSVERLMFAVMIGMLVSAVHGSLTTRTGGNLNDLPNRGSRIYWHKIKKDLGQSFILNCCILFFLSVDMLFVHHYLPEQSGEYAVALKYGQLVYFAAYSIITALVPKINMALAYDGDKFNRKSNTLTVILVGYILCISTGLGVYLISYSTWLPQSIPLLFSPNYSVASSILVPTGIVYAIFSVVVFLAYLHMLAGNSRLKIWLIIGVVCMVIAFSLNHHNLWQILFDEMIVYSLLSIGLLIDWLLYKRKIGDHANEV
ncbi:oligosaccharide flippase family protein [Paenibacillus xylanexedens]|uniref:oligosaccharide flippase family protein n=1 Tax=Paenibacillus xylanexedens TaxID=528191 RepID=UPI0011A42CA9|nr:oligosaccharide flippase family protein [Paenibacillus xylanexedens]